VPHTHRHTRAPWEQPHRTPAGRARPGRFRRQRATCTDADIPPTKKAGKVRQLFTLSDCAQIWLIGASGESRNELHLGAPSRQGSVYVRRVLGQGRGSPTVNAVPLPASGRACERICRHQSACATGVPGVPAGTATAAADDPAA
jgi:hypothetical protein